MFIVRLFERLSKEVNFRGIHELFAKGKRPYLLSENGFPVSFAYGRDDDERESELVILEL